MGRVKRKGAYEWQAGGWYADGYNGWHQNASCPVVAKVAEMVLTQGVNIRQTIEGWADIHDFMLRTKVPRSMHLLWGGQEIQRITRYVVTKDGKGLVKMMPPLGGFDKNGKPRDQWRPAEIQSGWLVQVCNDIKDAQGVAINYDYYIQECEKLVMGLK